MTWLYSLVTRLESRPEVRRHLSLVANPMAFIRAGRVFIAEQAPTTGRNGQAEVSVRATGAVQRALAAARQPIAYQDLADHLLATTPGATVDKIEKLLTELWQQTLLLTDLRPPLTTDNPTAFVARCLARIPAAQQEAAQLESILNAAAAWDASHSEDGAGSYHELIEQANKISRAVPETPFQVYMAWRLEGNCVTHAVGKEIARAGELLLRLSPLPNGVPYLEAYRNMFESRYGYEREVGLLELLDPHYGLGPLASYGAASGISHYKSNERSQTLLNLALRAVRDGQLVVDLDDAALARLETWSPSKATAPLSLDINAFVAARSVKALDAGDFQVVIGPNLGASAAGRNLGRFADLLGQAGRAALESAASREQAHTPGRIWAELVYLPRDLHAANVTIRPTIRSHEITLAASSGVESSKVIPLDELVVGVRNGRFYIRWTRHDVEVIPCAGHMLNTLRAPAVCRFLSEVGRDGETQLSSFDWGPAWGFPVLPRVQVGRIVLSPAQWRINELVWRGEQRATDSYEEFEAMLERWRARWHVPQHVYLSEGDNRLLLDRDDPAQAQ